METFIDSIGLQIECLICNSAFIMRILCGVVCSTKDDRSTFLAEERLKKHQEYFQNVQKHTYLKGRYDKITSVAIPLALASTCIVLIGRGMYNMANGIGKKA